jgi:hypothetical protein
MGGKDGGDSMTRTTILLGVAIIAACQLPAQSPTQGYALSKDGIGPFTMRTWVDVRGKEATFTGSARNDSGQSIRQASWCVQGIHQQSGCAFSLWTTGVWEPGETLEWNVTAPAGNGLPKHTVALSKVSLDEAGCLIVKHKGTIGRRLIWYSLIAIPIAPGAKYDLVDSLKMQGARATYKGHELQTLLDRGVRVIILQTNAKSADLAEAEDACRK